MITCSNKGTGSGAGSTGAAGSGGTAEAGTGTAGAGVDERAFGLICPFDLTAATEDSKDRWDNAPPAVPG